ncbi:iron complex outermembrane receptor protein [Nitrospirillum amazonense]|uniref:Iron complex outermembrane receptor protein n=1 Tax=Nitrospirillum amazonense TaxID=28077 RepID=A0A560FBU7_9PROT|nr:TonB-dependent receptor [Nitrospirillum amazonense]TWB19084.1 iron complex outermembrane receptor protein [Nitrospirillum amazonense]
MKARLGLYLQAAAVIALSGGAYAQTATAPAGPSDTIAEIVVTATKRETKLQETPIAVSAFSQESLDKQQVKDITDLSKFVPSLQFGQQGDQNAITLTLRGIGNDSAYTEVADPEVAMYVDGIYSPRAQGASVLMYDMERVEVLRGPQGTLFGRNATVGAVSLISAKPTFDKEYGNAEVVAGSYGRFGTRGMFNLPVSDKLAFRVAFVTDKHDGYVDYQPAPNVPGVNPAAYVTSGPKYYAGDQKSFRVSGAWRPTDRFSWDLNFEWYEDTGTPVEPLMQTPRPGTNLWSVQADTAPFQDRTAKSVHSKMDYDINDYLQLSYIAGASWLGGNNQVDADSGVLPPTSATTPSGAFEQNSTVWSSYDFFSHELQLKSSGVHTIDWILGAYYSHETNKIRFDIDQANGYRLGTFSWAGSFIQSDREIESAAGFGQATWHVTDDIRLTGGLRYTRDDKEDIGGRNVTCNGCTQGIFGRDPYSIPGYTASPNDVYGQWSKATWLVRADADIIKDVLMTYASVGTGFKSGNIEDGGKLAGPETLTNYEVGAKTTLFGGRATFNVAAYYEDFTGYQVNQAVTTRDAAGHVIGSQIVTQNAQGAKAYGLEAELAAKVTPRDTINLSLSAQHTEMEELQSIDARLYSGGDVSHLVELKGNELPHAPALSGTVGYEHVFDLPNGGTLTPRVSTHFETRSYLSFFNAGTYDEQKAYTRTDLAVRYDAPSGKWSLEGFVQNVENANIKSNAGAFGGPATPVWTAVYQPPQTWGVRAHASF